MISHTYFQICTTLGSQSIKFLENSFAEMDTSCDGWLELLSKNLQETAKALFIHVSICAGENVEACGIEQGESYNVRKEGKKKKKLCNTLRMKMENCQSSF